jgi:putative ABC transport system permease protein
VGVAIAFRWIKFPDLTGDGSFTLGGVITARLVSLGTPPPIAILVALIAGTLAGLGTCAMHKYLRVPKILAGILMTMGLYTINLRILGVPNLGLPISSSIFSVLPEGSGHTWALYILVLLGALTLIILFLLYIILESKTGLSIRIAGANPKMAIAQGISPNKLFWGLGAANGLIALSGSLVAQRSYNADIHMGTGQVIVAVAALFIGMIIFRKATARDLLAAGLFGSLIYMMLMQAALEFGVQAQDFRLISTVIVLVCIVIAALRGGHKALRKGADAFGIDI